LACRHEGVARESVLVFLVPIEIVEDDLEPGSRVGRGAVVHELQELLATPALSVLCLDLSGRNLEGGEQSGRAVPLVIVTVPCQGTSVWQLQIALGALQRLDRRLLVDANDDRIVGRRHVEADDIGGFGGELGILAFAPAFPSGEIDLLLAKETTDVVDVDVAERLGDQL
jgi:hypothetical protein